MSHRGEVSYAGLQRSMAPGCPTALLMRLAWGRVTSSLMQHGRNNGKKLMAVRIIKHSFDIIHLLTDQNPIQVLVDAIINRQAAATCLCPAVYAAQHARPACMHGSLSVCQRCPAYTNMLHCRLTAAQCEASTCMGCTTACTPLMPSLQRPT